MNPILIVLAVVSLLHGIRDVMQYYGKKNFLTTFLHVYENRRWEMPSAIASFSVALILFWLGI